MIEGLAGRVFWLRELNKALAARAAVYDPEWPVCQAWFERVQSKVTPTNVFWSTFGEPNQLMYALSRTSGTAIIGTPDGRIEQIYLVRADSTGHNGINLSAFVVAADDGVRQEGVVRWSTGTPKLYTYTPSQSSWEYQPINAVNDRGSVSLSFLLKRGLRDLVTYIESQERRV